jgi:hypothetical protein
LFCGLSGAKPNKCNREKLPALSPQSIEKPCIPYIFGLSYIKLSRKKAHSNIPRTIAERLERLAPYYAKAAFKNMHLCFSIAAYTTKPSGIESCAFPIFWA